MLNKRPKKLKNVVLIEGKSLVIESDWNIHLSFLFVSLGDPRNPIETNLKLKVINCSCMNVKGWEIFLQFLFVF